MTGLLFLAKQKSSPWRMGGQVDVKAGLRIAYSNQNYFKPKLCQAKIYYLPTQQIGAH